MKAVENTPAPVGMADNPGAAGGFADGVSDRSAGGFVAGILSSMPDGDPPDLMLWGVEVDAQGMPGRR